MIIPPHPPTHTLTCLFFRPFKLMLTKVMWSHRIWPALQLGSVSQKGKHRCWRRCKIWQYRESNAAWQPSSMRVSRCDVKLNCRRRTARRHIFWRDSNHKSSMRRWRFFLSLLFSTLFKSSSPVAQSHTTKHNWINHFSRPFYNTYKYKWNSVCGHIGPELGNFSITSFLLAKSQLSYWVELILTLAA